MNAIRNFGIRHAQTALGALGRLSQHWAATALMILVIGIALALPACLQVVLMNARAAGGDWNRTVEISVYLKPATTLARAQQLAAAVRQRADVSAVRVISADDGLAEFKKRSGFGEALAALQDNPLPHALIVRPTPTAIDGQHMAKLAEELKRETDVDVVQLDSAWIERFNAIMDALRRASVAIEVLLGLGVVVIVGSAIRADIQSRHDEIEITKLVGASDAFVRRPFLYTGLWYGLGGGVLAVTISYVVVAVLNPAVRRIAALYGSRFELGGLGLIDSAALVGIAVALGWIGSFVAATRHLRAIQPR